MSLGTSSPSSSTSPSSSEVVKQKKHMKIAALVVVIIVIVIGAYLAYWWFSRSQFAWLFKGAYATYEGETIDPISVAIVVRSEVVDYNSTHARLLSHIEMYGSWMGTREYESTQWIDLTRKEYRMENWTLTGSYDGNVYIKGLGTRYCTVYEYASGDTSCTCYFDRSVWWIVGMKFSITGSPGHSVAVELDLTETNIPGLK